MSDTPQPIPGQLDIHGVAYVPPEALTVHVPPEAVGGLQGGPILYGSPEMARAELTRMGWDVVDEYLATQPGPDGKLFRLIPVGACSWVAL